MTRSPTDRRDAHGVEGYPYELNVICAAPGCDQQGTEAHHLWRRSDMIGPYWWVALPSEDAIVGNVVRLCHKHHEMVTANAAFIVWNGRGFDWNDLFSAAVPLSWQPPARPLEAPESNGEVNALVELGPPVSEPGVVAEGSCPTCLRPLPHPKEKSEAKRERRTFSITIPKDKRENGAEVLDTLLEESRKELARAGLPYGDADSAKYFVLATTLGLFVQHAKDVLGDG